MTIISKALNVLVKRRNKSLENENETDVSNIDDEIIKKIMKNESELEIECIIETLTELGYAPSILYDDNGFFAITDDCFQSTSYGDEPTDLDITFSIDGKLFQTSIRKALHIYLEDLNKEYWNELKREKKLKRILKKK